MTTTDARPAVIPHRYAVVSCASLTPHPENPNHGDVAGIGASIEAVGFYGVLLVQEATNRILAGEHRWRAARERGLAELPAVVIDCDDDIAKRIMLGDNQYARIAAWDSVALAEILGELAATPAELAATGFTDADLARLVARVNPDAPGEFREYDGDIETSYRCPNCQFEWSGKPK